MFRSNSKLFSLSWMKNCQINFDQPSIHQGYVWTLQIPQLLSQGLNLNTTRSFVFMDKSFIVPTGMGMPLNCSINGTAVVSLRMKSQFSINLPKIIAAGHVAPRYVPHDENIWLIHLFLTALFKFVSEYERRNFFNTYVLSSTFCLLLVVL